MKGIPKGTRDFGPKEMRKRNYIFDTIKRIFKLHGYGAIETPSMELLSNLMGKYGDEGDRLIFRITPRGDKLKKALNQPGISDIEFANKSEEALRYDLTVPFARYVVQHRNDISFPFKRYQIQPVWRADRPQRGRYREFYQCDADVIGSDSLWNEVDLVAIINEVFTKLNLPDVKININNRKVLMGVAESIGVSDRVIDLTVALDKLDKIGPEGVQKELLGKGFTEAQIGRVEELFKLSDNWEENFTVLETFMANSEIGQQGLDELKTLYKYCQSLNLGNIYFNVTLARGLNYYTGAIFEVTHPQFPSSICGGGRYDNLTGVFGLPDVSGVGISFGADRIYDLLEDLNLFPEEAASGLVLGCVNFGEKEAIYAQKLVAELRTKGIQAEVYPSSAKMKKQMKYFGERNAQYVVMAGTQEIENKTYTLKNMTTGEQSSVSLNEIINHLSE